LISATLKRILPWLALAALLAAADQASKYAIGSSLRLGEVREITPFFNLVLAYNRGAAFSFLSEAAGWQRGMFIGIAAFATAVIVVLLAKHSGERLFCAGLALILGGAIGNLTDRVLLGHVVDFLDFHALGWHFWAFNLADSSITVGAGILILDGFRGRNSELDDQKP
jgi:signal peptidase II